MSRVREFYDRWFLALEFVAAVAVALVLCLTAEYVWTQAAFQSALNGSRQSLYSAIASTAGSLLGFVLATVSIVMVFGQLPRLSLLRQSSAYRALYNVFFQAVYWLALTTVWAFVGLLADTDAHPRRIVTYVMVFFAIIVSFRIARTIWVLKKVTAIAIQRVDRRDLYSADML